MKTNTHDLAALVFVLLGLIIFNWYQSVSLSVLLPVGLVTGSALSALGLLYYGYFSKKSVDLRKKKERVLSIPEPLRIQNDNSVYLGKEADLSIPIYLPDSIRSRHVHILGATGSGKTESVILNFIKQDAARDLGCIILDAKGDASFFDTLERVVHKNRLKVFDLGGAGSLTYNPLADGSPIESGQRLFASLVWSEEYYKSKALTAIQKIFQGHHQYGGAKGNPTLNKVLSYLSDFDSYINVTGSSHLDRKVIMQEFSELSGLRDQVKMLTLGHLEASLSPAEKAQIDLRTAQKGDVIYFRLQSLMSPQLVGIVGRLIINHLSFIAGSIQRNSKSVRKLVPVFLDEFASFACPEFSDLISKARSAGFALHFSHQSVGDLKQVSDAFLSQITDNSATKIVLRINDPDTAEFFARTFGTRVFQKLTKRVSNVQDSDEGEFQGEGSSREAHQFRAAPDLFKNHPTGTGSVLVSHGYASECGASSAMRVGFPRVV